MTSRVQTLRSSTTGNTPGSGTRQPGELWLNFADFQLGMIDASRNAQKLVAVRYFQTTANYSAGDMVVQAGALYIANGSITAGAFNASNWTKVATATDIAGIVIPGPSATTPAMDGTATIGSATTYARADHIHPSDTSRAPLASPAFTGTPSMPTGTIGVTQTAGDNSTKLATTAYVGAAIAASPPVVPNPNRFDNGDMWVDQHNSGASVAIPAAAYVACPDRWWTSNALAKFTVGQNYSVATKAPGFQYFFGLQVTGGGAAPAAAAFNVVYQGIEYDTFSDFGWGTVNAQPATLSFWVNSSLTGNFSFYLQGNVSPYRIFITTYNIPTANTWTKIVVNVPADTTVSSTNWTGAGNQVGLALGFDLGSGANGQTSTGLGAWQNSATANCATGAVKLVATSNAKWAITGVKLELGSVATPWLHEDLARSLARCGRYFQYMNYYTIAGYAAAGLGVFGGIPIFPSMRATPTVSFSSTALVNCSGFSVSGLTNTGLLLSALVTATGQGSVESNVLISAEI